MSEALRPPEINPSEGGVEPNRQTNDAQTNLPITETSFRQGPFGEQLNVLSADGSTAFGGRIGTQLTVAAYRQLEHNNSELKDEVTKKTKLLEETREKIAKLETQIATAKLQVKHLTGISWIMTAIYTIATIIISYGVGNLQEAYGKVIFGLGCLFFVIGYLSQLILLRRSTDD